MTLKEKFEEIDLIQTGYENFYIDSDRCEEITDEFAIGFADWLTKLAYKDTWNKTSEQLLKKYKKEKGL